jgi:hypothetical protein
MAGRKKPNLVHCIDFLSPDKKPVPGKIAAASRDNLDNLMERLYTTYVEEE